MQAHLAAQRPRQLGQLTEFASFASVSGVDEHRDDVLACAAWVERRLRDAGLERVGVHEAGGNPVLYGEWLGAGPEAPTVLVYGHYDVQPPDPLELWTSPPFEPTIRDGCLYARGVSDNKAQIFLAIAAVEATLAVDGRLPCNVKLLVDGEEELRADRLDALIAARREQLAADLLLNTDSTFLAPGVPSVPVGVRGMVALELSITTAAGDLHSGLFGGVAPNALQVLATLLATLRAPDGSILVDGFYDDVAPVSAAERAAWARLPLDEEAIRAQAGVLRLMGDGDHSAIERQWARPTLDLNGIWGGFQGQGTKTVIPARAHAKLSCRLVPDQRMDEVLAQLVAHLERHTPPDARLTIESTLAGAPPMLTAPDHPAVQAALGALAAGFERPAQLTRLGVSVPINEIAARLLGIPAVMLGFSAPTDAFHAPDEHFSLDSFDRGLRTLVEFLPRLAALWER
jgi:acetylornithine deacetylase/succinyl-diaminopimelate desuccinylase-like protein